MGHTQHEPAYDARRPWNAGRMVGAKKALKPRDVWAIRFFLEHEGRLRDRALFDLAIDSKLRGCDVVKIKIGDLVTGGCIRHQAMVVQQKTGRPVQFELLEPARTSLLSWLERRGGSLDDFALPSRVDRAGHLSTRQYARLVDEWVTAVGLARQDYGTHFPAADQSRAGLQAYGKSPRGSDFAGPHEDRDHRSLPRCRYRRRARAVGEHRTLMPAPGAPAKRGTPGIVLASNLNEWPLPSSLSIPWNVVNWVESGGARPLGIEHFR